MNHQREVCEVLGVEAPEVASYLGRLMEVRSSVWHSSSCRWPLLILEGLVTASAS